MVFLVTLVSLDASGARVPLVVVAVLFCTRFACVVFDTTPDLVAVAFFPSVTSTLVTLETSPRAARFLVAPPTLALAPDFLDCRGLEGWDSSSTFRAAALARVRRVELLTLFSSFSAATTRARVVRPYQGQK